MSHFYINPKRTRNIYDLSSDEPFKISRSKIDAFLECPKCFYLDRRIGIGRPPGYPFSLNVAVDTLLKKEFDVHRVKKSKHPFMTEYEIDAMPFEHEMMDEWRENFKGVQYHHKPTNLIFTGAVDDVWINPKGELHVVDYKATAKTDEVSLDADWQIGYKRQVEVYQWLLRNNGFKVSDTAYFVYCNGNADAEAFDKKIEFRVSVLPYKGNANWIDQTIKDLHQCLNTDTVPDAGSDCDYCRYREAINNENL